jgi:hypothetical protein
MGALTDSDNPRDYLYRMKQREQEASGIELSTLCRQLKLTSSDGKSYKTDCVNTEAAFRIIQSIPSPKAEPFKRWLAEVGYQRIQEIENPELAQQRMRKLYLDKGYPDDWVENGASCPPVFTRSHARERKMALPVRGISTSMVRPPLEFRGRILTYAPGSESVRSLRTSTHPEAMIVGT